MKKLRGVFDATLQSVSIFRQQDTVGDFRGVQSPLGFELLNVILELLESGIMYGFLCFYTCDIRSQLRYQGHVCVFIRFQSVSIRFNLTKSCVVGNFRGVQSPLGFELLNVILELFEPGIFQFPGGIMEGALLELRFERVYLALIRVDDLAETRIVFRHRVSLHFRPTSCSEVLGLLVVTIHFQPVQHGFVRCTNDTHTSIAIRISYISRCTWSINTTIICDPVHCHIITEYTFFLWCRLKSVRKISEKST